MADNLLLPISLEQMTGSDSLVFVSAVYVYDAGTSDLKNVYTNATLSTAAANPIIADGDGVLPARYIGTGSYKLVIKDTEGYPTEDLSSHWTTFKTIDNLPGALDTSTFASDEATPITPVVSKTSDFTVLTSHQGTVFDCDPTGGNITATLPSAVTAGDNFRVTFKHTGTANSVIIATTSAQTIDEGTTFTLDQQWEAITLVSDGANWLITDSARLVSDVVYPPGHIFGLTLSNAADTANDITVAAGSCRDSTNTVNLDLASAVTKQIDAPWAVGTSAGGRSSSGLADGTWHVFVIGKALGADANVLFHDTLTPVSDAVMPTGFVYYRRVGSIVRASSVNLGFFQDGNEFTLKAPTVNLNAGTLDNEERTATLTTVPAGIRVKARVSGYATVADLNGFLIYCADISNPTITGSSGPFTAAGEVAAEPSAAARQAALGFTTSVFTSTSREIKYKGSPSIGSKQISIYAEAWIDTRGASA